MKKFLMGVLCVCAMVCAGCGEKSDPESIHKKIIKDGINVELSQEEYRVMIDYVMEVMDNKNIMPLTDNKRPYFFEFAMMLNYKENSLDENNKEKLELIHKKSQE